MKNDTTPSPPLARRRFSKDKECASLPPPHAAWRGEVNRGKGAIRRVRADDWQEGESAEEVLAASPGASGVGANARLDCAWEGANGTGRSSGDPASLGRPIGDQKNENSRQHRAWRKAQGESGRGSGWGATPGVTQVDTWQPEGWRTNWESSGANPSGATQGVSQTNANPRKTEAWRNAPGASHVTANPRQKEAWRKANGESNDGNPSAATPGMTLVNVNPRQTKAWRKASCESSGENPSGATPGASQVNANPRQTEAWRKANGESSSGSPPGATLGASHVNANPRQTEAWRKANGVSSGRNPSGATPGASHVNANPRQMEAWRKANGNQSSGTPSSGATPNASYVNANPPQTDAWQKANDERSTAAALAPAMSPASHIGSWDSPFEISSTVCANSGTGEGTPEVSSAQSMPGWDEPFRPSSLSTWGSESASVPPHDLPNEGASVSTVRGEGNEKGRNVDSYDEFSRASRFIRKIEAHNVKSHTRKDEEDGDDSSLGSLPSLESTSQVGTQNNLEDDSSLPSLVSASAMESVNETGSLPSLMDAEEADRRINESSFRPSFSRDGSTVQESRSRSRRSHQQGGQRSKWGGQPVVPEEDSPDVSECGSLPSLMDAEEADAVAQRPSRAMMGIPIQEEDSGGDVEHAPSINHRSQQEDEEYFNDDAAVSNVKAPASVTSWYCNRAFLISVVLALLACGIGISVGLASLSSPSSDHSASTLVTRDADGPSEGLFSPPIATHSPTAIPTSVPTKRPPVLSWDKVGNDLIPRNSSTIHTKSFGARVSLSGLGDRIAVSAPLATDKQGQNESGTIFVFEYQRNDSEGANLGEEKWLQIGQMLNGEASGDAAGTGLALSPFDGSKLAVGYPGNNGGYVKVFEYKERGNNFDRSVAGWVQMGQTLRSEGAGNEMGFNLAFDYEGMTLAVSSPGFGMDDASKDMGRVNVYKYDNATKIWKPMGSPTSATLMGDAPGDRFGTGLDLSYGGDVLAVGAPYNSNRGVDGAGHVKVFQFQDNDWVLLDRDIWGESENAGFGKVVSLDAKGKWLTSGSHGADPSPEITGAGRVRAFSYAAAVGWSQYGFDINGVSPLGGLGNDLDMSANSFRIIAAGRNDVSKGTVGFVKVYEEETATWNELEGELGGMSLGALSSTVGEGEWLNGGPSVSISYYGSIIAVGLENVAFEDNEGNTEGDAVERGVVRVYSWRAMTAG